MTETQRGGGGTPHTQNARGAALAIPALPSLAPPTARLRPPPRRALYAALASPDLERSTKAPMFLSLLFKASAGRLAFFLMCCPAVLPPAHGGAGPGARRPARGRPPKMGCLACLCSP